MDESTSFPTQNNSNNPILTLNFNLISWISRLFYPAQDTIIKTI